MIHLVPRAEPVGPQDQPRRPQLPAVRDANRRVRRVVDMERRIVVDRDDPIGAGRSHHEGGIS